MSNEQKSNTEVSNRARGTNRETVLRKERIPLHEQNSITLLSLDPNYKYRVVNDTYGRIARFLAAGWSIVEGDIHDTYSGQGRQVEAQRSSQLWRTVNNGIDAPCKDGVFMRIPIELFNEDQAKKAERTDMEEKEIDPEGLIRKAQQLGSRWNLHRQKPK